MNDRQHLTQAATRRMLVGILTMLLCLSDALAHLATAQASKPAATPTTPATAQPNKPAATPAAGEATKIPPEALDSLVAPVALFPDPLLAQTLAASTYPLEIVQLHQWLAKNPGLKDQALATAVAKEPWDASIQAMAGLPT
jgi:hypothetical protein